MTLLVIHLQYLSVTCNPFCFHIVHWVLPVTLLCLLVYSDGAIFVHILCVLTSAFITNFLINFMMMIIIVYFYLCAEYLPLYT